MLRVFATAALMVAGLAGPAAAQSCLTVPTGTGDAAIHCSDGRVGHLVTEPGGAAVTGMLSGQVFTAPAEAAAPLGLSSGVAVAPLASDLQIRTRPLAPPPLKAPAIQARDKPPAKTQSQPNS